MANIIQVESPNVTYGDTFIESQYDYCTTNVETTATGRYKVLSSAAILLAQAYYVFPYFLTMK